MIINPIWHLERMLRVNKYGTSGMRKYLDEEAFRITPVMTLEQIQKHIKQKKYNISFDEYDYKELKTELYYKVFDNTIEAIESYLYKRYNDNREMFPLMYWGEYCFRYEKHTTSNFKEYKKTIEALNKIRLFLDKNPKYQGYTGEQYQETDLHNHIELIYEGGFSWRAWGQLMASYMNSKEKKRKYCYMDYYM